MTDKILGREDAEVESLRQKEYPHMNNGIYLDHSGTTIYAKSAVEAFSHKMLANLYGNPHSENSPAHLSGTTVDQVREKALHFLGADPKHYDLVFVANATAAIKLVADSFRDLAEKSRTRRFWYGYHKDSHTSLVGVRELTYGQHYCFESDFSVETFLRSPESIFVNLHHANLGLFAYPAQSNMTGRRLPLDWAGRTRHSDYLHNTYTLLDAAAMATTAPLNAIFENVDQAPDFTCLSFYKIFGFPDLGGLIIRKDSGHILALRKYFGGGTVTNVSTLGETWHRSKALHGYKLHEGLEDGTLPFHSIVALGEAIEVHKRLYRSMDTISSRTSRLTVRLYTGIAGLRHGNGRPLARIYSDDGQPFDDPKKQGPVIAFNIQRADGQYVPYTEVEALANAAGIFIRSGGVCNPGGLFSALGYEPWMSERALSAGHHCSGTRGIGVIHNIPTGIVRASIGAMTTTREVDILVNFLRETFLKVGSKEWASSARSTLCVPLGEISLFDMPPADYANVKFPDVRELPRPRHVSHYSLSVPSTPL